MGATRCSCILDERFNRLVQDPTCPATALHAVFPVSAPDRPV